MPSDRYIARRAIRNRIDAADHTIEQWEQRLREAHTSAMPAMEPTREDLSVTETAGITVSATWLAAALELAYEIGRDEGR